MSARVLAIALSLLCGVPRAAAARAPAERTDEAPPRHAVLLVGIGDYPDEAQPEFPDLPGCGNDVERMRKLLTQRFGFDESEIHVLKDAEATHERIVTEFHDWLIARAGPETEVLYAFSGHGSRVPDASGVREAEPDGMDSTFVAWDSRTNGAEGENDITDDEMRSLLVALTAKTARVTIITDSCFSGGGMRGGGGTTTSGGRLGLVRAGADGSRSRSHAASLPFWPLDVPLLDDDDPTRPDPTRYVHVAACSPHQQAREWNLGDGEKKTSFGALTWFLGSRLRSSQPGETWRQVVDVVARWVSSQIPMQSVQIEGALDRMLFSGGFKPRPPGFDAHYDETKRCVVIDAGRLHGLRDRQALAVSDADGKSIGTATISGAKEIAATAAWDGEMPEIAYHTALRVTPKSIPAGRPSLAIRADNAAVREKLAARSDVMLADDPDLPAARIEVDPPGAKADEVATIRFVGTDGIAFWPGPSESGASDAWLTRFSDRLDSLVELERRYRDVLEMSNEPGTLAVRGQFTPPVAADLEGPGDGRRWPVQVSAALVSEPGKEDGAEMSGGAFSAVVDKSRTDAQIVRLDVTNPNDKKLWVTVLSVTEDREINVIHPAEREEFVVAPHDTRKVFAQISVNPNLKLDRPMRDRYLVIATTEPANFYPLTSKTVLRGGADSTHVPPLLANAIRREVTRGKPIAFEEAFGFGIATVDLLVDSK